MVKYQAEIGETLHCPVCNKSFMATEDTKYIISGGYTCSWQCFLRRCKEREKVKEGEKQRRLAKGC